MAAGGVAPTVNGGGLALPVGSPAEDERAVRGRPKSRYPGASPCATGSANAPPRGRAAACQSRQSGDHRRAGHRGFSRSKPLKPLRAERRMFRRDRGDYARVLFYFCTRGCGCACASSVPRALIQGEAMKEARAPPRRHNNRGDDACRLSARALSGANGASPARGAVTTTGVMVHI